MAKSKLKEWLENTELLESIVEESRNDKEIYETMCISESAYYDYMDKSKEFSEIIKNAKAGRQKRIVERLRKLHDAMWEKACGYISKETVKEIKGEKNQRVSIIEREFSHDPTLMIYLDKTYGANINADEIKARAELSRARAEETRLSIEAESVEDMDAIREEVYGEE